MVALTAKETGVTGKETALTTTQIVHAAKETVLTATEIVHAGSHSGLATTQIVHAGREACIASKEDGVATRQYGLATTLSRSAILQFCQTGRENAGTINQPVGLPPMAFGSLSDAAAWYAACVGEGTLS